MWGGACIVGDLYENGTPVTYDYGSVSVERNDPILVAVVERLKDAANGKSASLKIQEIPSGMKYRIDEYDGLESVVTPDEYDWMIAE